VPSTVFQQKLSVESVRRPIIAAPCSEVSVLPFLDKLIVLATLICKPLDSLPKVLLPMILYPQRAEG